MANVYAVIKNSLVVNVVSSDPTYAQSQGWIELVGNAGIGWSYIDGQFVAPVPPAPTPEEIQAENKQQAQTLLSETDWTCTVDITNPQYSNPYLTNQNEFLSYRSTVRAIAVNPPTTPAVFPTQPVAQWSE